MKDGQKYWLLIGLCITCAILSFSWSIYFIAERTINLRHKNEMEVMEFERRKTILPARPDYAHPYYRNSYRKMEDEMEDYNLEKAFGAAMGIIAEWQLWADTVEAVLADGGPNHAAHPDKEIKREDD